MSLTRRYPSDSVEKLAGAVASAQVDLNPHQVDAALFAFRSPLSKGAMLADEVGLGKTIEAGLVISQSWAERKRRILVITPSNLRKQWYQELTEKFFLPCRILEAKSYNAAIRQGHFRRSRSQEIVICSYQFARSKAADVKRVPWDLVVIDEAHRLRNVYKPSNVIANTLKLALARQGQAAADGDAAAKLPARTVRSRQLHRRAHVRRSEEFPRAVRQSEPGAGVPDAQGTAQARVPSHAAPAGHCLRPVHSPPSHSCRSSRRRKAKTGSTTLVSEYLRRDNLQALPASQRSLMTLVLRKLLASSTFAIAGALSTISNRLKAQATTAGAARIARRRTRPGLRSTGRNRRGMDRKTSRPNRSPTPTAPPSSARSPISTPSPGSPLPSSTTPRARRCSTALDVAFAKAAELGARAKGHHLHRVAPHAELPAARAGRQPVRRRHRALQRLQHRRPLQADLRRLAANAIEGTDRVTGSRTADMRSALVDYFREQGRIMIATEAGAEGINLQFCSLW